MATIDVSGREIVEVRISQRNRGWRELARDYHRGSPRVAIETINNRDVIGYCEGCQAVFVDGDPEKKVALVYVDGVMTCYGECLPEAKEG